MSGITGIFTSDIYQQYQQTNVNTASFREKVYNDTFESVLHQRANQLFSQEVAAEKGSADSQGDTLDLSTLDSNGDGITDKREIYYGLKSHQMDRVISYLNDLDTDGSNTINQEESGLSEGRFSLADKDGNGELDSKELLAFRGIQMINNRVNWLMNNLDQDQDKALTLDESGMTEDGFNGIDVNGDGTLDRQELLVEHIAYYNYLASQIQTQTENELATAESSTTSTGE